MERMTENGRLDHLAAMFPDTLAGPVRTLLREKADRLEELRLRADCPVTWVAGDRELLLKRSEGGTEDPEGETRRRDRILLRGAGRRESGPAEEARPGGGGADPEGLRTDLICTTGDLEQILRRASDYAAYAVRDQIVSGFLCLPGGHRLGICGQAVTGPEGIRSIRELQAMNLRIAREVPGSADGIVNLLWSHPASTLILGPPGRGKTTVLRDLVRQISDRLRARVGLVDERGEVAACVGGSPQLRVGKRTDVLSLCPKDRGILLLLRSMSPQWIAVDEISAPEDVEAVIRASYCGVRFLATAHAWTREDLHRRPLYRALVEAGVFENLVMIGPDRSLICERTGEGGCVC